MGKVVATEHMSLDGVMEAPEHWAFQYQSDDLGAVMQGGMKAGNAMLFGRVTFEEFATFWPTSDMEPFASYMRNAPKYVVSTTLENAEWGEGNSVPIIRDNLAEEVTTLKQKSEHDIGIIGSGGLVRSLLAEGLLDELRLFVHPVILGKGKRLFGDVTQNGLKLVDLRAFDSGSVMLAYQPKADS